MNKATPLTKLACSANLSAMKILIFSLIMASSQLSYAGEISCKLSPSFTVKLQWQQQEAHYQYAIFQNGFEVSRENGEGFWEVPKSDFSSHPEVKALSDAGGFDYQRIEIARIFDPMGDGSMIMVGEFFGPNRERFGSGFTTNMGGKGRCTP